MLRTVILKPFRNLYKVVGRSKYLCFVHNFTFEINYSGEENTSLCSCTEWLSLEALSI